jgi:hypothetical protein
MARTVAQIEQQINDKIASMPSLAAIVPNPSQVANWKTFIHSIAVCIAVFEQIIDVFKSEIEAKIAAGAVGSEPWLQSKAFEFQYDATTPQLLDIVNFAPAYNPIDPSKRIITRASVKTVGRGVVYVKVAKSEPPVALSTPELSAIQSYFTDGGDGTYAGRSRGLGFAGIDVIAQTFNADKLYLAGKIYYNGQFSASIANNVIMAINNYLATGIDTEGGISLVGITNAIESAEGFIDVLLDDVATRPDLGSYTYMRQNKTDFIPNQITYAGYIVEETNPGNTFLDKLIFVAA